MVTIFDKGEPLAHFAKKKFGRSTYEAVSVESSWNAIQSAKDWRKSGYRARVVPFRKTRSIVYIK